ncbi:hypothetical protein MVEN_00397900 [Mycena venus]|uniref:Uncharacterized protein n=1 Tax=Mycena venus TaxID=2733690 RepID=A0A8H7DB50_9AGAR|nr:hypothetical protein MVEN_00397900 [Mycena venus]
MASPSTTPGTSSPSPSPSSSSQIKDPNSNLYLFTFLATLILLFAVSCGIIVRACYVRRRFRRNVERAMEQGLVLAPPDQGLKFVSPPKLYDVWLTDKHLTPSWAGSASSWADITVMLHLFQYSPWMQNCIRTGLPNSRCRRLPFVLNPPPHRLHPRNHFKFPCSLQMPAPPHPPTALTSDDEDYLPEVVLGVTQAHQPS